MNLPVIFIAAALTSAVPVPVPGLNIVTAKVVRDGRPAEEQARVITVSELTRELRSHRGRPVILHFWATWCVPCLTELPFLDRAAKLLSSKGVDFLPVSLDSPTQRSAQHVGALLTQRVRDPHWSPILKVGDIDAFMTSIDPHWEGAIPVFFAFDSDTRMRRTHLGNINQAELDALADCVMSAKRNRAALSR
jgi:thiol-disulfide isomerase/thioredoxin